MVEISRRNLAFILFFYVVSGVLQPIVLEVLNYNGSCAHTTMLFVLPNYLGMSMVYFAPQNKEYQATNGVNSNNVRSVALLCFLDIVSQTLNLTGLVYAGSLLFTILYSSCTLWTAIFSYVILNRSLHPMQWISCITVVCGLALASLGSLSEGEYVIEGGAMILTGSIIHSLTYILSEKIMVQINDPISPESISYTMGLFGTVVYSSWQIFYTIPNFKVLVADQIVQHNGNVTVIICSFLLLIFINFVHAYCFFNLLGSIGATTTGVLKGVQTVIVFIASHFAFCSLQESQCFTNEKGLSLIVVVIGVLGYSYFHKSSSSAARTESSYTYANIDEMPHIYYTEIKADGQKKTSKPMYKSFAHIPS
jgi:drug/metabolite transporter (DMT)-like permease